MAKIYSVLFAFACMCLVAFVHADDGFGGRLVIQKQVLNRNAVAGREFTINIHIFNVGLGPAFDVQISDDVPQELGDDVVGLTSATWSVIPAQSNVSHSYVIVPDKAVSDVKIVPAILSYRADFDATATTGYSNYPGLLDVTRSAPADRVIGAHLKEWAIFFALAAAAIAIPSGLWLSQGDAKSR